MRFLIIGASGFVGRHTLSYVKSLGHNAIGTQSGLKFPDLITFDILRHRIEDIAEKSFFTSAEPVFGVICAAISQIDRCVREKDISHILNVDKTICLIQDLDALGVKPVFLSTSFVYDGSTGYYHEEYPICPINEYGRHKVAVEDFIRRNVPKALVLRLDKIVGDNPSENHLLSEWYQWIQNGQPITCIKDQIFSPTFVDDVARAIFLGCKLGLPGVYNVANSESFSRQELARQFTNALGKDVAIVAKPQEEFRFLDPRPLKSYLDSTKFIKATGMRFTSMREVFRNFKSNDRDHDGSIGSIQNLALEEFK